jgi:hypothetical protein
MRLLRRLLVVGALVLFAFFAGERAEDVLNAVVGFFMDIQGPGEVWKIVPLITIGLVAFIVIGLLKGAQAAGGAMFSSGKGFLVGAAIILGIAVISLLGGGDAPKDQTYKPPYPGG